MRTTNTQIKYGNYNRKSSEDRERQILSIGSQIDWAQKIAQERNLKIIKEYVEEKSAEAPYQRPIFDQMVKDVRTGVINALIEWKLDRLARNPEEAGIILGMLKRGELKHIITNEREYRPEDNAIISYVDFGMADQYSRDLSKNVKRGLKTKLDMGWYPSRAPLGYLNTKIAEKGRNTIINDPERFETVKNMWQTMLTSRYTAPQILETMNKEWKFKTRTTKRFVGKPLCRANIYKMFNNRFYCGFYEYPKGSGNWYRGKHNQMVTEDEFDMVQEMLGNKKRPRPLTRRFAFTGLMRCGNCGAMVTAEEKIKRQKNGNEHKYIYYHCTKRIDEDCIEKAIELKELTKQINLLIGGLTISDKFVHWAIRYLHEIRQSEAQSHEEILANKQKRLNDVAKQMDNLLLKYTSPENSTGELISDIEYKTLKLGFVKEKNSLEGDLQTQIKEMDRWIELSERTFNFARYSSLWFANGDLETKRAIFACLGSDLIVKDQKLNVQLHKPFQFIFDNLTTIEKELVMVRTSENESFQGQRVFLDSNCLTLRRE